MKMTEAQRAAIEAQGDTLVVAGAGTGKTRTLVQRCLDRLMDESSPMELDRMLLVTFTEAAAAEIRQRIREALEGRLDEGGDPDRIQRHLAALDTAPIGTLHSFCLRLIRQHFHQLGLDPQVTVLAEEPSALLAREVLDELFESLYNDQGFEAQRFRKFLSEYARGWEERLKRLILNLHRFTQTRPDPGGWFEGQHRMYGEAEPTAWRCHYFEAVASWCGEWLPIWEAEEACNPWRDRMVEVLGEARLPGAEDGQDPARRAQAYEVLSEFFARVEAVWSDTSRAPRGSITAYRRPLADFHSEKEVLASFCPAPQGGEPLAEDWEWVRHHMRTLIDLARAFEGRYAEVKRQRGAVDFHDLEQFALQLLWDAVEDRPTDLAWEWRDRLELVFVDEYQDINEAQDTLIRALSREGDAANRFLVGDVKQSIYRFRQAEPSIFQGYADRWSRGPDPSGQGRSLYLSDNFRSRESLLAFINPLFAALMRRSMGGVTYDEAARLEFGDRPARPMEAHTVDEPPAVEVHLRVRPGAAREETEGAEAPAVPGDASDTELEARLVASRLSQLKASAHEVWDREARCMRPVCWSDMVVLLRAPSSRVEAYAKEFAAAGIPLQAKRSGFFDSIEVKDLIELLKLLDNPLQDIPATAVLRSPLAGLTPRELARLRADVPQGVYWSAARSWHRRYTRGGQEAPEGESLPQTAERDRLAVKLGVFFERYRKWRREGRHQSLTRRLEMVLEETSYRDWLRTQPRGEQRQANVARLLTLAHEFDELHAQGLHRFLRMLEAQQEVSGDREPAQGDAGESVRLMSIHQSKGLEFPVVVAADLGHRFNVSDGRDGLRLDPELGICPLIRWPETGQHYASLPLWLAKQRQRREALGEEMRILYVLLTRAQDRLILTGTVSEKALHETWQEQPASPLSDRQLLKATSVLDWLGPWLHQQAPEETWHLRPEGQAGLWSWRVHRGDDDAVEKAGPSSAGPGPADETDLDALCERLAWSYPHQTATTTVAKTSVSLLRRRYEAVDEEAQAASFLRPARFTDRPAAREKGLSAAEIGVAHHRFLQWADLKQPSSLLKEEITRLTRAGRLSPVEAEALDGSALERFWDSEVGRAIRERAGGVRREWPFTCRLTSSDLAGLAHPDIASIPPGEYLIVQGVVDLLVEDGEGVWLLDFKTDQIEPADLGVKLEAYRPQLELYAWAVARILGRPVRKCWLYFLALGEAVEV